MLGEIRANTFRPDTTRSGWLARSPDTLLPGDGDFASIAVGRLDTPPGGDMVDGPPAPKRHMCEPGEWEHYHAHNQPSATESQPDERDRDSGSWHHVGNAGNDAEEDVPLSEGEPFPELLRDSQLGASTGAEEDAESSSSSSSSSSGSSEASATEEQTLSQSARVESFNPLRSMSRVGSMSNLRCFTVPTVIRMPVKPSVADGRPECTDGWRGLTLSGLVALCVGRASC